MATDRWRAALLMEKTPAATTAATKTTKATATNPEPSFFSCILTLEVEARGAEDQPRVKRVVDALLAGLGATRLAGISARQMAELGRLRKMLERHWPKF